MRLPVIKHIVEFIEQNDEDYINETMETLENLIEAPGIKDEELDVIGELLSNFSGASDSFHESVEGFLFWNSFLDFTMYFNGS